MTSIQELTEVIRKELLKPVSSWDSYVPLFKSTEDKTLTIYLTEGISMPSEYNEMCHELITVPADWKVTLVLSNGGGYSHSAFMILDAMKQCKAPIHGLVKGSVASACTIITMGCDTIEVADFTEFMCHNYAHSASGTGSQVKEYVNFTDREFRKASKEIYEGFLTEEEIEDISTHDKEIWLNKEQVLSRWPNKKFRLNRL
jgi:ATP-dependent protease ClpP protease subunit